MFDVKGEIIREKAVFYGKTDVCKMMSKRRPGRMEAAGAAEFKPER